MICVYDQQCQGIAGGRAYHDNEDEAKRLCDHGDHWRVGQTIREARRIEKMAASALAGTDAFYRKVARTIRNNTNT